MRNWKRKTRYRHKQNYRIWVNSESSNWTPNIKRFKQIRKLQTSETRKINAWIKRELATKDHYEDAFYHPCRIKLVSMEEDFIVGISLVDGSSPRSCSLYCGGAVFFTKEEAEARAACIKEHGMDVYLDVFYNTFNDAGATHPFPQPRSNVYSGEEKVLDSVSFQKE